MNKKIEPLPRSIIENMIASGQIYWRRPLPLISRRWAWLIVAGAVALIIIGAIVFPSL